MERYAAVFVAGVIFTLATETGVFVRALHRALTEDDSVTEDDGTPVATFLSGPQHTIQEA